jgi:translation elongation factor EF-Tu-like GTPase
MSRLLEIPRDFHAELELLPKEQSQRTRPLLSGFRGQVRWAGATSDIDVEIVPTSGPIAPGDRGHVDVRFLFRDEQRVVSEGETFSLREGATEIGIGKVVLADP